MKDEGGEETSKRVKTFAAEGLVKSVIKGRRDKGGKVKVFLKELEKGRGVINEDILTVRKGFI